MPTGNLGSLASHAITMLNQTQFAGGIISSLSDIINVVMKCKHARRKNKPDYFMKTLLLKQ